MYFVSFFSGSSGDEMDSTQELQNNTEVPNGLDVIPLNMQDHYLDRIKVSEYLIDIFYREQRILERNSLGINRLRLITVVIA